MVSKNARAHEADATENVISPEDEAKLNKELGFSDEAAAVALVKPEGGNLYTDDQLRDIVDFDDFLAALGEDALNAEDFLGTGAEPLVKDELSRLVGVPLILLQWNFTESKQHASWFAYIECIDHHNNRYCFTQGAKNGMRDELYELSARTGKFNNLVCKKGFDYRPWTYMDPETDKPQVIHVFNIAR